MQQVSSTAYLILPGKQFFSVAFACLLLAGQPGNSALAAGSSATVQDQATGSKPPGSATAADSEPPARWGKLLPLPVFVTEPAIGEGLGATLIYFHQDDEAEKPKVSTAQDIGKTGERSKPPPVATGIFALYTNNDTAAVGLGHSNRFAQDRYRLRAAAVEARINSDYYIGDRAFSFQMEGSLLFSDLKLRLGDSGAFLGISASYANASNNFLTGVDEIDATSLLDFDFVDAGMAASLIYDSRDNTIMPADGYLLELTHWRYDEAIGGDFDYDKTRLRALYFRRLGRDYVLGARVDASRVEGAPPFYADPYVRLRGIPALRYQGETAAAIELEGRYHLAERWSVSLFAGAGSTRVGDKQVESGDDIRTFGFGTRFLALREQDAWIGLDIARGPENVAWYIQIGSPW